MRANVNPPDEFFETKEDAALGDAEGDIYVRHKFQLGPHGFEVYVYQDETGYFLDGKWFPFERQDFANDAELIEEFLSHLSVQMTWAQSTVKDPSP